MANLLEKMVATPTGYVHPVTRKAEVVGDYSVSERKLEPWPDRSEYLLSARVGLTFLANSAEYDKALKQAKQHASVLLYRDIYELIEKAGYQVFNDQNKEALTSIEEALQIMRGNDHG